MKKRAVDTNILIRILADNASQQAKDAQALLLEGKLIVPTTVALETEWVLRSRFRLPPGEINQLLVRLFALPTVEAAQPTLMERTLKAHAEGMDLADAIHLFGSVDCDEFVTFDRHLARHTAGLADAPPVLLL